jgi:predicted nucleic acid-binding protein
MSIFGSALLPTGMYSTRSRSLGLRDSALRGSPFAAFTELGLLRLLANPHVIGQDMLTPRQAWRVYDEWRMDPRVDFLLEPAGFGERWRELGEKVIGGPNARTDAYLAAFAAVADAAIVTLDRRLNSLGAARVEHLL